MTKHKDGLYALYLRKSRADIERERYGEFETLLIHERDMVAVAKRDGYVLDKPYYKELVSGEHIADRHEFQKLMRKVENREYAGILVHEVSRLGRGEPMEYGYVLFTLKRTGTLVITLGRIYDPNNPDDYKALQMEMFMSNMELGTTKWRLMNGARGKAALGSFVKSVPPYGYDRIKVNGYWTLIANECAATVHYIFTDVAAGTPRSTVAHNMNNAGLRTPSGGLWSATRLTAIVRNPHYCGKIRYGYSTKEVIPTDSFNYVVKTRFNDDCLIVEGLHEGIVSEELWIQANEQIGKLPRRKQDNDLKNPLATLLVCQKCGRSIHRYVSGNKTPRYRHARFCDCAIHEAKVDTVVDMVNDALEQIVTDMEARQSIGEPNSQEAELAALTKQLEQEERRIEKLMDLYFADAITVDEFKEKRSSMTANKEALEKRLHKLEKETVPSPKELVFTIRGALTKLRDESVPVEAKNAALKSFIDRIEYTNDAPPRSRTDDIHLNIVFKQ